MRAHPSCVHLTEPVPSDLVERLLRLQMRFVGFVPDQSRYRDCSFLRAATLLRRYEQRLGVALTQTPVAAQCLRASVVPPIRQPVPYAHNLSRRFALRAPDRIAFVGYCAAIKEICTGAGDDSAVRRRGVAIADIKSLLHSNCPEFALLSPSRFRPELEHRPQHPNFLEALRLADLSLFATSLAPKAR